MFKRCSKCGEEQALTFFNKSKDNVGELTTWCKACVKKAGRAYYLANPRKQLLRSAKQNANARGIECTLTLDDIPAIPKNCPVLGIELSVPLVGRSDTSPSLDRIDNSKGYTPDNVVVVSWRVNRLKGSATLDELQRIAAYYERKLNA